MQQDICCTCKNDKPWGCDTFIKDKEVIKGIGVVGCLQYKNDKDKTQFHGSDHLPNNQGLRE